MPRKKEDAAEETPNSASAEETNEETTETATAAAPEASEDNSENAETASAGSTGILSSIAETVTSTVSSVVETVSSTVSNVVSSVTGGDEAEAKTGRGNRAQRVGVVTSDKMTKTVVVRVDRVIKHPKYRRYVRRKKQFMAHDETGATIGDKVRIIETRPMSARKRWRVVEIIQKAAK